MAKQKNRFFSARIVGMKNQNGWGSANVQGMELFRGRACDNVKNGSG